jgi:putative NADH-flavin reductase
VPHGTTLVVDLNIEQQGWNVFAFVRTPTKLPEALRSQITVIQGDLCNAADVAAAVKQATPTVIVDASSAIPFGHAQGQAPNNADRATIFRSTYTALEGRYNDCVILIVGGVLLTEPGGVIPDWTSWMLAFVLRNIAMRQPFRDLEGAVAWLFQGTDPAFRFVYARLGPIVGEPSKGELR